MTQSEFLIEYGLLDFNFHEISGGKVVYLNPEEDVWCKGVIAPGTIIGPIESPCTLINELKNFKFGYRLQNYLYIY